MPYAGNEIADEKPPFSRVCSSHSCNRSIFSCVIWNLRPYLPARNEPPRATDSVRIMETPQILPKKAEAMVGAKANCPLKTRYPENVSRTSSGIGNPMIPSTSREKNCPSTHTGKSIAEDFPPNLLLFIFFPARQAGRIDFSTGYSR